MKSMKLAAMADGYWWKGNLNQGYILAVEHRSFNTRIAPTAGIHSGESRDWRINDQASRARSR